ncbi:MAG: M20 family metallopeptidase [Planktomarina sp.]|jgi:hippurate hydrolase|nr:M20 family metallopeptidase [Planktomarina sp.]MDT2057375.1 M20 aminoacylase family protein [Planktomarina sp.]MDT2072338.1 M20 aminoacylase family protein [Planktomarina sp.]MDT2077384.1 M20 aminoacylase family protein [Planktomarina sp.]HAJ83759.1 amidohydrolase [Paracoccaceae bacterium]|tara:strand:- start:7803 stop:8969 length:1167 start_codon:yes stop_codon:yes gene_type:complete
MPIVNRIAEFSEDMKTWRRHLHQNPELGFDCHKTAAFVMARLREFGINEIYDGIAQSGVVALIHGQAPGPVIGLRADMDALPIQEATGAKYASLIDGKMHACGHDGHTSMLLGAAKYLAETRNFVGTVALIFQPAEENGGGGEVMVQEGILERFNIKTVYALHTEPGSPVGQLSTTPGPIMAAVDTFEIHITGQGGHGAMPHLAVDAIPAAVSITQAFQTIVSRNHNSVEDLVVSVTQIHAGAIDNVINDDAFVGGTVRTFLGHVQDMVERRMSEICAGHAAAFGVDVRCVYTRGYPATINSEEQTAFASKVAREICGDNLTETRRTREMGAEDFSYFLEKRPGCYLFLGQGDGAAWHNAAFDFNDDVAPVGASFFARLVERAHPMEA